MPITSVDLAGVVEDLQVDLWKLLHFRNGMAEVTNRNFFAIELDFFKRMALMSKFEVDGILVQLKNIKST